MMLGEATVFKYKWKLLFHGEVVVVVVQKFLIVLLAVVDVNCRFILIDVRILGSLSNSSILLQDKLKYGGT